MILGIDVGGSTTKIVGLDSNGKRIGMLSAFEDIRCHFPLSNRVTVLKGKKQFAQNPTKKPHKISPEKRKK